MAQGIKLSHRFFEELVRPAFADRFPDLFKRAAIGVFGNGSDTIGTDDDLSRDHCWGPRNNIVLTDEDFGEFGEPLILHLRDSLPESFEGFPIHYPRLTRAGVSVESVGNYFECFAKMKDPPSSELDWFKTTEADLFHLVGGQVFQDPLGEFTRRKEAFAYYPENVWKKRIADWCLCFTGSASPYNVHRCSKRGDFISAEVFFGFALKRAMELCFLLNRTYAPYIKWLPRLLKELPRLGTEVESLIQQALATPDWTRRTEALVEIARLHARELHSMGLTEEPNDDGFDQDFATLTLYQSAVQIYHTLPEEMIHARFNEAEWWEILAREALSNGDNYFQEKLVGEEK